jgi:bifunctional non-homologous end joining protein LigD
MASQTSERVSTLPRVKPMRLRLIKEPFDNPDYLMEWKADGFRAVAYIENRECKLVSRNLRNLRFESLRAALAALPVTNAILDGEIICLDPQGVSRFNWLLSARGAGQAIFYSFDLLWLNSVDLRGIPLLERKSRLAELVRASQCQRLLYAQHIEGAGKELFAEISRRDLEGIVAKRKTGLYRDDRPDWLKVKNRTYSQAEGRHSLLNRTRKR